MTEKKARLGWWAGDRFWQCTADIPQAHTPRMARCSREATRDPDADGNPTKCGVHCAAAIKRRKETSDEQYQKKLAKWAGDTLDRKLTSEAAEIVRKIADGHNDPRSLCADWVARRDASDNG